MGDVVTAVDGVSLLNADNLRNTIGLLMVGQTIKLDIIRNGKEKTLTAKVTEVQSSKTQTGDVHPKLRGATFGDIEQSSPAYGRIQGIMLYSVERGSPAWVAGLRSYDIVTSVNRQPVANLEQFKQLVSNQPELLLNIVRDNQAMFLLLR